MTKWDGGKIEKAFVRELQQMKPGEARVALQQLVRKAAVAGAEDFLLWSQSSPATTVDLNKSAARFCRRSATLAWLVPDSGLGTTAEEEADGDEL